MNIGIKLYTIIAAFLMSSCATTFYQVYNVKSIEESITNTDKLFFEDENCRISYNFWSNGGDIGFDFYNKTDHNIYVNLNKSNFILNGFANDYYKNRTFTTSKSKAASISNASMSSVAVTGANVNNNIQTNQVKSLGSAKISSSVGYAISIKEDSLIRIPSKTSKRISEYSINNAPIRNCDLFKNPNTKETNTISYNLEKSPFVFRNMITYEINGVSKLVINNFFVSGITNYPESDFLESKYDVFCGQKSASQTIYYKLYDINKFYIKYSKGSDSRKH